MKAFMLAALPMVLLGLAMTIIAVGFGRKDSEEKAEKRRRRMSVGAGIGLAFGVVLSICDLWQSRGASCGLCTLWGMAVGSLVRVK